jgi:hypothetical protein
LFVVDTHHSLTTKEEFEDTKGVIRILIIYVSIQAIKTSIHEEKNRGSFSLRKRRILFSVKVV